MHKHEKLIDELGGYQRIASELTLKESRVRLWKLRGVAWKFRPTIARMAIERRVELPKDFLEPQTA